MTIKVSPSLHSTSGSRTALNTFFPPVLVFILSAVVCESRFTASLTEPRFTRAFTACPFHGPRPLCPSPCPCQAICLCPSWAARSEQSPHPDRSACQEPEQQFPFRA